MIAHALTYFVAFALPGLLGFLSFGAYTHVLTPSEYAVYSVGTSIAFLIGNVCFGWIRFSIGRYQSEEPETNFIPFALICFLITALAVGPFALFGALRLVDLAPMAIAAVLTMTLAQAMFDITQEIRRSRHLSGAFTRASVLRSLLSFVFSVSAAMYFRLGYPVVVGIAGSFFVMTASFLFSQRAAMKGGRLEGALIVRFLRYGMPLALSGLVFAGNTTLARILVSSELGADAAGKFGAALDVTSQITSMLAGSVTSIMGPAAIIAYRRAGLPGAQRELTQGVVLFMAILLPAIGGLMVTARPFALVISGTEFESMVGALLPVLAVSRGFDVFAQFYLHLGFQIIEKPFRQVLCGTTTVAVNIVLNLILTRSYGLQGAAWALLLADLAGLAMSLWLLKPVFNIPLPVFDFAKIAGCVGLMIVGCLAFQATLQVGALSTLLLTAGFGIIVYGTSAYLADVANTRSKSVLSRGYLTLAKFRR